MTTDEAVTREGSLDDPAGVMTRLRRTFARGRTRDYGWRVAQLQAMARLLEEREGEIAAALKSDLDRSAFDAWFGDIASTRGEIDFALKNLRKWMKPRRERLPLTLKPGTARVQYEPLGTVLVIGPWNYPVFLTLGPMVAAIAAGNCMVLKPSEIAPATSALLARLLPQYLDSDAVAVVEGDGETTQELLAQGFDHAVFTGGTEIGRKIMAGAAPTLTPVTLELGGKSPTIVTEDADLGVVARRLVWSKLLNSGQTCIAPDYVLVQDGVRDALVSELRTALAEQRAGATEGLKVVNERQYQRLKDYLADSRGQVVVGGQTDDASLRIEPTVLVDPDPDEPAMTEEIFGPILPVLTYDRLDDAIDFVNARPKPLAVYVFSRSSAVAQDVVERVPSGGATINHIAMHCLVPSLPFGGVGNSGMGAYHGEWGFRTLSHRKAVLHKTMHPDPRLIYPPYGRRTEKLMRKLF